MASLLFTKCGAMVNALILSSVGSQIERKRHDLALEKLQRAWDEWSKDRVKELDFINKRLREKNEARTYINNVDEAMLEYYRVFAKTNKAFTTRASLIRPKKMVNYYLLQWVLK